MHRLGIFTALLLVVVGLTPLLLAEEEAPASTAPAPEDGQGDVRPAATHARVVVGHDAQDLFESYPTLLRDLRAMLPYASVDRRSSIVVVRGTPAEQRYVEARLDLLRDPGGPPAAPLPDVDAQPLRSHAGSSRRSAARVTVYDDVGDLLGKHPALMEDIRCLLPEADVNLEGHKLAACLGDGEMYVLMDWLRGLRYAQARGAKHPRLARVIDATSDEAGLRAEIQALRTEVRALRAELRKLRQMLETMVEAGR